MEGIVQNKLTVERTILTMKIGQSAPNTMLVKPMSSMGLGFTTRVTSAVSSVSLIVNAADAPMMAFGCTQGNWMVHRCLEIVLMAMLVNVNAVISKEIQQKGSRKKAVGLGLIVPSLTLVNIPVAANLTIIFRSTTEER
jgi:hypothetical protein